jgi:hypothetical protein
MATSVPAITYGPSTTTTLPATLESSATPMLSVTPILSATSRLSAMTPPPIPGALTVVPFPQLASHSPAYGRDISSVALRASSIVHGTLSVPTVNLKVLGPIIQRYTVIDRPLPRELFAAHLKQNSHSLEAPCVFARIELSHDIAFRRFLNTQTWVHLRVSEPNLLPSDVGQSMLGVNAHIIPNDHFPFDHCFGRFWANHCANDRGADKGKGKGKGK